MQGDTKGYKIGDQYESYFLAFTVVRWVDLLYLSEVLPIPTQRCRWKHRTAWVQSLMEITN